MNTLSENIKQLRISQKLSQTELAEKMNVSVKTISHWETGYSEPSAAQIVTLANIFDVTADELLGRF